MSVRARLLRQRSARAALLFLGFLCASAAGADLLASDLPLAVRVDGRLHLLPCLFHPPSLIDDDQQTLSRRAAWMIRTPIHYGPLASRPGGVQAPLSPPSLSHLAGTDDRGRDVAARLLHGTRTALAIGPAAVALYLLLGLLVGVACALGPRLDRLLARAIEIGLTFPTFFLLLAIQGAWGVPSLWEVAVAIALTRWPDVARLTRAAALQAAAAPHVEAARALGAGPLRIALHHVLPHAAGPALVAAAHGVGQAVLIEAALAFLGFGVPPPTASWGELLAEAQGAGLPWWLVAAPTAAIALTVLTCHALADAVRAALDPTGR
ncbi:MAG: ABC transporter permease [Myxococcales bacterium]|nr:ABC transporter permease [Myxococcales bacterium]